MNGRLTNLLRKVKIGLYLGLIFGILIGTYQAVSFAIEDDYTKIELAHVGLYIIQYQILISLALMLLAGLIFSLIWFVYDRFEGVAIAGLLVLATMVPVAKFINQAYLPGIKDIESIIGNITMMLFSLLVFVFLHLKFTKNLCILQRLYSNAVLIICLSVFVSLNIAYYVQPHSSQLVKSPKSYNSNFLDLFNLDSLKTLDSGLLTEEFSIDKFLHCFAVKHDSVKQELSDKIDSYYHEPNDAIVNADKIINREFTLWNVTKTLPDTIDWYDNITGDEVWLYALDEFEWMRHLMYAYILTNDEKYAAEFE